MAGQKDISRYWDLNKKAMISFLTLTQDERAEFSQLNLKLIDQGYFEDRNTPTYGLKQEDNFPCSNPFMQ